MVSLFRRVSTLYREHVEIMSDFVILKIDVKNAFNTLDRTAMLASTARHAPAALAYAKQAYGSPSMIFLGDGARLSSECGPQQGDPPAPMYFSVTFMDVVLETDRRFALLRETDSRLHAATLQLDPTGVRHDSLTSCFFLDDGAAAGHRDLVAAWFTILQEEAARVGLTINLAKCELVVPQAARDFYLNSGSMPAALRGIPIGSLDDWALLGTPCGTAEAAAAYIDKVCERVQRKTSAISSLPHTHLALALLRFCTGLPCVVHLMRGAGPVFDYSVIDGMMREAFQRITSLDSVEAWEQMSLPVKMGGLGFGSAVHTQAIAFVAAQAEADFLLPQLSPPASLPALIDDPRVAAALACPVLAQFPETAASAAESSRSGRTKQQRHLQRGFTKSVQEQRLTALEASLDIVGRARVKSASAPHAAGWLYGCADAPKDMWLSNAECVAAVRLRLGLPVCDGQSMCSFCHAKQMDTLGYHALRCMHGAWRTGVHNALRDELALLCKQALWAARVEVSPFPWNKRRLDFGYQRNGTQHFADVFTTFPLTTPAIIKAAAARSGGAPTLYEQQKHAKYAGDFAKYSTDFGIGAILHPIGFDHFGGIGDAGRAWLQSVCQAIVLRMQDEGMCYSLLARRVHVTLNFKLTQGIARILLANTAVPLRTSIASYPPQPQADPVPPSQPPTRRRRGQPQASATLPTSQSEGSHDPTGTPSFAPPPQTPAESQGEGTASGAGPQPLAMTRPTDPMYPSAYYATPQGSDTGVHWDDFDDVEAPWFSGGGSHAGSDASDPLQGSEAAVCPTGLLSGRAEFPRRKAWAASPTETDMAFASQAEPSARSSPREPDSGPEPQGPRRDPRDPRDSDTERDPRGRRPGEAGPACSSDDRERRPDAAAAAAPTEGTRDSRRDAAAAEGALSQRTLPPPGDDLGTPSPPQLAVSSASQRTAGPRPLAGGGPA